MRTRKRNPRSTKETASAVIANLVRRVADLEEWREQVLRGKDARSVPLDAESARVAEQHRDTMARKRAGEKDVRWNADPCIRYRECATLHPNARVTFRQLMPVEDDNVPSLHVSLARNYDELIAHLRDNHWRGGRASYKWTVSDDTQPQWATGVIQFEARPPQPMPMPPDLLPPGYPAGWYGERYWNGKEWMPVVLPKEQD